MRNSIFILIITASSSIAACGDITVKKPKDTTIAVDDGSTGKTESTDRKEVNSVKGVANQSSSIATKRSETSRIVDVSVQVKVKTTDETAPSDAEDAMLFEPKALSWSDAAKNCPDGYRLASRSEVVAMFDAGALADLGARGLIWTNTAAPLKEGLVWFVDADSGMSSPADPGVKMASMCVRVSG